MEAENKFDIVSGVSIATQYPVEKFLLRWKISNYSKIFNDIETTFTTSSKSISWVLEFEYNEGYPNQITLWANIDHSVRLHYQSVTKTCNNKCLQKEGKHVFDSRSNSCILLQIPLTQYDSATNIHSDVKFENDMLDFQCTMVLLGHSITKKCPVFNVLDFCSEQLNQDFQNLFQSKENCDMRISDGKNYIPVHKAILCARSSVFNIMLNSDMLEKNSNEVIIDDIDFETLQYFLSFLYCGKVNELTWSMAMSLYYAADKYDVNDLRCMCSEFLQSNLSTENVCSVLLLAHQHKDDNLKELAVFFIRMHASPVKLTQGWKDLVQTHPKIIAEIFY